MRSIILALDNRALDIKQTYNIPVVNRADFEELERMIGYLKVLLNTEHELISFSRDFPDRDVNDPVYQAFESAVRNSLINEDFIVLFYQLTHITNFGTMEEILKAMPGIGEIKDEYHPMFYSPYGIYYLWMEAYGYLPASMQPVD